MSSFRFLVWALVLFYPSACHALTIVGEPVSIGWNPSLDADSPIFLVQAVNNSGNESESVTYWQLEVLIVPGEDASGIVDIQEVRTPADYFFGAKFAGPTVLPARPLPGPNAVIFDFDSTLEFQGTPVSDNETADLVELEFQATPGALGTFNLTVSPRTGPEGGTYWSDSFFNEHDFDNVLSAGEPVVIGSITIVPEPSVVLLALYGSCLNLLFSRLHRRRQ